MADIENTRKLTDLLIAMEKAKRHKKLCYDRWFPAQKYNRASASAYAEALKVATDKYDDACRAYSVASIGVEMPPLKRSKTDAKSSSLSTGVNASTSSKSSDSPPSSVDNGSLSILSDDLNSQAKIQMLLQENFNLSMTNRGLNAECTSLKSEVESLTTQLSSKTQSLQTECSSLKAELQNVKGKLDAEREEWKKKVEHAGDWTVLSKRLRESYAKIKELEEYRADIQQRGKEIKKKVNERFSDMEKRINDLMTENEELTQAVRSSQDSEVYDDEHHESCHESSSGSEMGSDSDSDSEPDS
jgi:hypothetical protein